MVVKSGLSVWPTLRSFEARPDERACRDAPVSEMMAEVREDEVAVDACVCWLSDDAWAAVARTTANQGRDIVYLSVQQEVQQETGSGGARPLYTQEGVWVAPTLPLQRGNALPPQEDPVREA